MLSALQRAKGRLLEAAQRVKPQALFDEAGYASRIEDNLIDGVSRELFEVDYDAGAGQELRGKMRATHSSAALVINTFAPWRRRLTNLSIAGAREFTELRFEEIFPTGLAGTPPHLDVVARGPILVAVESKFLEYLTPKRAKFSPAYETIQDFRRDTPWYELIRVLRCDPDYYRFLDVAQLVKHALGIMKADSRGKQKLVYLYWEPLNHEDFPEFDRHRIEIADLAARVRGVGLAFESIRYSALWDSWSAIGKEAWLPDHLDKLRLRYNLVI